MTTKRERRNNPVSHPIAPVAGVDYNRLVMDISGLLEQARRTAVRTVNSVLTVTYWEVGRRIVEFEQGGKVRAEYGKELLVKLGNDLTKKHGRGFSWRNIYQMRAFYLGWEILQTPSAKLEARAKCQMVSDESTGGIVQTSSGQSNILQTVSAKLLSEAFPLSWSHYVCLLSVRSPQARAFYESEAIRGGWSVRQLDRQIGTQFYERTTHSQRPELMLARGQRAKPDDAMSLQ